MQLADPRRGVAGDVLVVGDVRADGTVWFHWRPSLGSRLAALLATAWTRVRRRDGTPRAPPW